MELLPYLKRSHPIMRLPLTVNRPAASAKRKTPADSWTKRATIGRRAPCHAFTLFALFCSHSIISKAKALQPAFLCSAANRFVLSGALARSFTLVDSPKSRCHCGGGSAAAAAVAAKADVGFCTPTIGGDADGDGSLYLFLMVRVLELL